MSLWCVCHCAQQSHVNFPFLEMSEVGEGYESIKRIVNETLPFGRSHDLDFAGGVLHSVILDSGNTAVHNRWFACTCHDHDHVSSTSQLHRNPSFLLPPSSVYNLLPLAFKAFSTSLLWHFTISSLSMYNMAGPNTCHGCGASLQVKLSVGGNQEKMKILYRLCRLL